MNKKLIPVMLCFFAMGFVDLVGIASNYVKADLNLTDSMANILPSLVFLWFLIFSIPTSLLMNRIGRKKTVLLSLWLTLAALIIPVLTMDLWPLLISFSLLGIGNAVMQTSLNPLVDTVMRGGHLASTLTFGQFIKSIASFMAPLIASWGATGQLISFGLGWRVLYPIYMSLGILATLGLYLTRIEEEVPKQGDVVSFMDAFRLLKHPFVLGCFVAIICHVGIDVGTSVTAPRILMERSGLPLDQAVLATMVYFIAKAAGSFSGSLIMSRMKDWTFLLISVLMMVVAAVGLLTLHDVTLLYASVALMGFGNGNPFSIVCSRAMNAMPDRKNEISGLLIMGICGGAIFPSLMGAASDAVQSQSGAVWAMSVGIVYLLLFWAVPHFGRHSA